jgi:hypothetical protein
MPTAGEMFTAQLGLDIDPKVLDDGLEEAYRKLY